MNKLHKVFFSILGFFQLTDINNRLSISNIAVMVILVKIALSPVIDWVVVGGLLISLLNYGYKRRCLLVKEREDRADLTLSTPASLDLTPFTTRLDDIEKVANEAKEKASKIALATGITTKTYHG